MEKFTCLLPGKELPDLKEDFRAYQHQIILNAKALENAFRREGIRMVSDGTDNHLLLLDFSGTDVTGKQLETLLPDAEVHRLASAGHFPMETHSKALRDYLRGWIRFNG